MLKLHLIEDLLVREKRDLRPTLGRLTDNLYGPFGLTISAFEMIMLAVAIDVSFKPLTQGVNDTDADTVKTAGNLISLIVELTASVQRRKNHL